MYIVTIIYSASLGKLLSDRIGKIMPEYVEHDEFEKLQQKLKVVYEHLGLDFSHSDDNHQEAEEVKEEKTSTFEGFEQEEIDLGTGAIEVVPEDSSPEGWNSINDEEDKDHTIRVSLERKEKIPDKLEPINILPELVDHTNKITFEQHATIFNGESNLTSLIVEFPLTKKTLFNAIYDVEEVEEVVSRFNTVLHSSNGEISETYYAQAYKELEDHKFLKAKSGEPGYEKQVVDEYVKTILKELKRRMDILQ